jgi:predicted methyltransferase
MGYVLPDWAANCWNRRMCNSISPCTDEQYAVVCHDLQLSVFVGSREECVRFLGDDGFDVEAHDPARVEDLPLL